MTNTSYKCPDPILKVYPHKELVSMLEMLINSNYEYLQREYPRLSNAMMRLPPGEDGTRMILRFEVWAWFMADQAVEKTFRQHDRSPFSEPARMMRYLKDRLFEEVEASIETAEKGA